MNSMGLIDRFALWLLNRKGSSIKLSAPDALRQCEIQFRMIDFPLPSRTKRGTLWQVEYRDGDFPAPAGIAWVTHDPSMREVWETTTRLDFVLVLDNFRGKGIAKKLIHQCFDRWPDLELGTGISEGGQAVLRSVCRERGLPPPEDIRIF